MVKLKLKKRAIFGISIVLVIIAIAVIVLLVINRKPSISKVLLGSWSTPGGTIYTFKNDNTGFMKVPLNKYKFTYKIEDDKIVIDFEDKSAFDPVYEYTLDGEKLILKGDNGTFKFTRVMENNKKN